MKASIEKHFVKGDKSCAEAAYIIGCEIAGVEPEQSVIKAIGGFSGGCCVGVQCGAVSGCIGALGTAFGTGHAHNAPELRALVTQFMTRFVEEIGQLNCTELKKVYRVEPCRCELLLEKTLDIYSCILNHKI